MTYGFKLALGVYNSTPSGTLLQRVQVGDGLWGIPKVHSGHH